MITQEQLTKICPSIKGERAVKIATALDTICPQYGINTPNILHEFLARLLVECKEFKVFDENLNYTTAERLMEVWPTRFKTKNEATPYLSNPQKLAEKVYSLRMGNKTPEDAFMFRGGGPIMITGRDMYELCRLYINKMTNKNYTIEEIANLLRTDLEIGIHSACWLFAVVKKMIPYAKQDALYKIVTRIAGALTNIKETNEYYQLCVKYITDTPGLPEGNKKPTEDKQPSTAVTDQNEKTPVD